MRELLVPGVLNPESCFGNPSSAHAFGFPSVARLHDARAQVARLISSRSDEIVFESCSTETINHALKGIVSLVDPVFSSRRHVVTSAVEHPAVVEALVSLKDTIVVSIVPVDEFGMVDPQKVAEAVRPGETALVTMLALSSSSPSPSSCN